MGAAFDATQWRPAAALSSVVLLAPQQHADTWEDCVTGSYFFHRTTDAEGLQWREEEGGSSGFSKSGVTFIYRTAETCAG